MLFNVELEATVTVGAGDFRLLVYVVAILARLCLSGRKVGRSMGIGACVLGLRCKFCLIAMTTNAFAVRWCGLRWAFAMAGATLETRGLVSINKQLIVGGER